MSERVDVHGADFARAAYAERSLKETFPQLMEYLSPGLRVLDVGCGPGSITTDVAKFVSPGSVVGVDLQETAVQQARAAAAEHGLDNAEFAVSDALRLPFGDGRFDVTYSHALLEWVLDPVAVLKEQIRVTKRSGWVCAMLLTYDTFAMYPRFESLWHFVEALRVLADPTNPGTYADRFVGRKAVQMFKEAGLARFELKPMEPRVWYAGHPDRQLPTSLRGLRFFLTNDLPDAVRFRDRLLQLGAMNKWSLEQAQREWEQWLAHPHALHVQTNLFAAGEVA